LDFVLGFLDCLWAAFQSDDGWVAGSRTRFDVLWAHVDVVDACSLFDLLDDGTSGTDNLAFGTSEYLEFLSDFSKGVGSSRSAIATTL
jgi:hypothetical protein